MKKYIEASAEAGKIFFQDFHDKEKIVMLNMLKFKKTAEYPEDAFSKKISGKEAYDIYIKNTQSKLKQLDSRVLFYGAGNRFLIGPEHEKWDAVLLVEHASILNFMEFAKSTDYINNLKHRTAALEDSRLLPMKQQLGKY